jgi:hypothetical protein
MWRSPARPALAIDTVGRLTGRPPASRRSTTGRQRLAVSCYGIVLVLGSAVCLGFFVLVSLPFTVGLLTGAAAELRSSDPVQIADAAATVTYLALLAAVVSSVVAAARQQALAETPRGERPTTGGAMNQRDKAESAG